MLTSVAYGLNIRRRDGEVITSETSTESPKEILEKPDLGEIWNDLFTVPRTSSCKAEINRQDIISEVLADEEARNNEGEGRDIIINDSAFGWIKKWGFGPVAYLLDFWDPLFRAEVIEEFKAIHNATMHEDPENTPEYNDVFDFAGRINHAPPEKQNSLIRDLKRFEKNL